MDDDLPPLTHAPDGLYEADVDALIAEYFAVDEPRAAEHRSTRRHDRQTIRAALRGPSIEPHRVDDAAA